MNNRIILLIYISFVCLVSASQMESISKFSSDRTPLYSTNSQQIKKYSSSNSQFSEGKSTNFDNKVLQIPVNSDGTLISGSQNQVIYDSKLGKRNVIQAPVQGMETKRIVMQSTMMPVIETKKSITEKPIKITTMSSTLSNQDPSLPTEGGYLVIQDVYKNEDALAALSFIVSKLPELRSSKIVRASYQVVSGLNFQFIFEYQFTKGVKIGYRVLVYRNLENVHRIVENSYLDIPRPPAGSFIHLTNKNEAPYIDKINELLVAKLRSTVQGNLELIDFDVSGPYYIMQYKVNHNSFIKVQIIYDPIVNDLRILSASKQNIQTIQSKSYTTPVQSSTLRTSSSDLSSLSTNSYERITAPSTTTTTTVISSPNTNLNSGNKQGATTQKINVPIYIKKEVFQKYQIPQTGISFTNIVQYRESQDIDYDSFDNATPQIKQLVLSILQAVISKIEAIDSKYELVAIKYRIQQTKLSIFVVTIIRGQKSMQTIVIRLPRKEIFAKISGVTINNSNLNTVNVVNTKPVITNSIQTQRYTTDASIISKPITTTSTTVNDVNRISTIQTTQTTQRRDNQENIDRPISKDMSKVIRTQSEYTNSNSKNFDSNSAKSKNEKVINSQETKRIEQYRSIQPSVTTKIQTRSNPEIQIRSNPEVSIPTLSTTSSTIKTISQPIQSTKVITSQISSNPIYNSPITSTIVSPVLPIRSKITEISDPVSSPLEPKYSKTETTITEQRPVYTEKVTTYTQKKSTPINQTPIIQTPIIQTPIIQTRTVSEPVIVHENIVKNKVARYTITSGNNLIKSASGISDPAFIPFLTSSYVDSSDSNTIDRIANYIIQKVKIEGDFSIILVNQMKYGVRIVIQMNDSHKLYEAIVTSDNKSPQLLLWRRISSITDVDPEAFSQYYRIDTDQDLKSLIKQVFKSEQMISKFQQIISAEKKVSYDGVYYRFIVQSTSNRQFLIVFYYIPDKNYNEILQYELINNGYDATREQRLSYIPEDDVSFNTARDYLSKKYASVLRDTMISFISSYETQQFKYFRIVFTGMNGRYEAILAIGLQNQQVINVRWQKLDDGYIPLAMQKLNNDNQYKSIKKSVNEHIKTKFGFEATPAFCQLKNIPAFSSYYKLLFNNPFPFIIYIEQRDSDHGLYVRGMERIQVTPTSQYYNDRVFAGYSLINLSQLQYDEIYQAFLTILSSRPELRNTNYEVVAAFDLKTPSGLFYKIIYRIKGVLYLAYFSLTFANKEYKLISFEPFESKIESGDYRWKCFSFNTQVKNCLKCEDDYILTLGRCYKKVQACTLQFASSCQVCNPGFVKSYGICESSPQKAIPKPKQTVVNTEQTIVTAKGCKTIYYEPNDNCLTYKNSLCEKCSYRFVLREGICKKVQDECEIYDNSGICLNCYNNYYLSNGYCVALDPLCAAANNEGYCTKCYKNYVNIEGKCYIMSNVQMNSSSAPPSDPLCIEWNGNRCEKCEFGCFMSKKTAKCTIKDPYCQEFDLQAEACIICVRGYSLNEGRKCERVY